MMCLLFVLCQIIGTQDDVFSICLVSDHWNTRWCVFYLSCVRSLEHKIMCFLFVLCQIIGTQDNVFSICLVSDHWNTRWCVCYLSCSRSLEHSYMEVLQELYLHFPYILSWLPPSAPLHQEWMVTEQINSHVIHFSSFPCAAVWVRFGWLLAIALGPQTPEHVRGKGCLG
jgi:hypothetical protein